MTYTITVRQWKRPLVVEMGASILESALAEGRTYPHGCKSGNCGACKSRLISGEVQMAPFSEYALSPAEQAAGLILACRAVPWSDCEVAWLEEDELVDHPRRRLDCRVVGIEPLTHDITRLRLAIEAGGPYDFTPGQYAETTLPGLPTRDYSMANTPGDEGLVFHVRALEGGLVSTAVRERLAVGDDVRIEGPYGIAYWRARHEGPVLALAGGSGLAPIKAIVEHALGSGFNAPIRLWHGVREERDVYLEDHFRALGRAHPNFDYRIVLSEPSGSSERATGTLADALADGPENLDHTRVYLAGPPVMVEACLSRLYERGVARENCHADAFYTEAEKTRLEMVG
jgi:ferredoxin-NAD(P)+ reductase (naphthalene dioxygenase ferredoxin-specific)